MLPSPARSSCDLTGHLLASRDTAVDSASCVPSLTFRVLGIKKENSHPSSTDTQDAPPTAVSVTAVTLRGQTEEAAPSAKAGDRIAVRAESPFPLPSLR